MKNYSSLVLDVNQCAIDGFEIRTKVVLGFIEKLKKEGFELETYLCNLEELTGEEVQKRLLRKIASYKFIGVTDNNLITVSDYRDEYDNYCNFVSFTELNNIMLEKVPSSSSNKTPELDNLVVKLEDLNPTSRSIIDLFVGKLMRCGYELESYLRDGDYNDNAFSGFQYLGINKVEDSTDSNTIYLSADVDSYGDDAEFVTISRLEEIMNGKSDNETELDLEKMSTPELLDIITKAKNIIKEREQ